MRTFLQEKKAPDPRQCRVCGNVTLSPARRNAGRLAWVLLGIALAFTIVDVYENGRLSGDVLSALHAARARFEQEVGSAHAAPRRAHE
ncbi:MAG TPA: hypothetical protein VGL09_12150 [Methylomirabilota bacterium]